MSKIQEAMRKLQANTTKQRTGTIERNSMSVAQVTPNAHGQSSTKDDDIQNQNIVRIDRAALCDVGLVAPEQDEHMMANQYRELKRPLLAHAFGKRATKIKDGNLIMVTSALPGEGKTFTSINLALSIAREEDYSVMLVDADVAKRHLSQIFGAIDEPGLLDVIDDKSLDYRNVVLPTDVDGLTIFPAGSPRSNATELFNSDRMEQLLHELSANNRNRIILFDTSPLLQTSEAKVLTGLVGQIVLVVRAEATSHAAVLAALSTLAGDKAINLVLNQARHFDATSDHYGYGYARAEPAEIVESGADGWED